MWYKDEACRFVYQMLKRAQIKCLSICLLMHVLQAQAQIELQVICVDKGNEALKELIKFQSVFSNKQAVDNYLKMSVYILYGQKGIWQLRWIRLCNMRTYLLRNSFWGKIILGVS